MRKIFTICCMIVMISSLLILASCNNESKDKKKVALGRYIEKNVDFSIQEQGDMWFNKTAEGKIQIYQQTEAERLKLYERQEDGSFLEIDHERLNEFNKEYPLAVITAVTTDKEGNIYLLQLDCDDPNELAMPKGSNIIKISDSGITVHPLHIENEFNCIVPNQIVVLENGDLISYEETINEVTRFNIETGELIKSYDEAEGQNILVMNQKLYTINIEENQIDIYNIESGQIEKHIPCSITLDDSTLLISGEDDDLYIVSSSGIFHLAQDGSIWEEVVNDNGLSLSLPSIYIEQAVYSNKGFMVKLITDSMPMIKEYVYSNTTPTKATEEINIYALEENLAVEEAIASYQLNHPEISINMQYGRRETEDISRDDAIKALNVCFASRKCIT